MSLLYNIAKLRRHTYHYIIITTIHRHTRITRSHDTLAHTLTHTKANKHLQTNKQTNKHLQTNKQTNIERWPQLLL